MILIFYLWIFIQIVAEMLPISSSGHLYLLQEYARKSNIFVEQFVAPVPLKTFYYFLHGFTFVLVLFFLLHYFITRKVSVDYIKKTVIHIFVADTITVLFYLIIHYFDLKIPVSLGFFITMILLLSLYKVPRGVDSEISVTRAALIGTVQGVSLLPGISRLASTFVAGRWLNLQPMTAFIFSWLIQLPLIILAFSKSLLLIAKSENWQHLLNLPMAFVIVISCIIAWCVLMMMVKLVHEDRVSWFGWYMMVPLVISLLV